MTEGSGPHKEGEEADPMAESKAKLVQSIREEAGPGHDTPAHDAAIAEMHR